MVLRVKVFCKISKFEFFAIFLNFNFVFFWLGIWSESLTSGGRAGKGGGGGGGGVGGVGGGGGGGGGISEWRRFSCSNLKNTPMKFH